MPSCFVSIIFTIYGKNVFCYGHQVYGNAFFPKFTNATIVYTSFDLWMSRGGVDTFILVINYLIEVWEPMYVTIGLLKVNKTTNLGMVQQLQSLVEFFCLIH